MSKNKSANNPNITENEARKMDNKYASLKEDYLELHQEVRGLRKKLEKCKDSRKLLEAEVRFLRSRKRMFASKKLLELIDPEASPKDHLKMMCKNRSNIASIESLPIEHEPTTHGSHPWLQLDKSPHSFSVPETIDGLQSSSLLRQQTPSVTGTAIGEPASRKRRVQSNDTLNSPDSKGSKKRKLKEKGQQKPNPPTDEGSDNSFWDKK